jgi:hypothetical protein
MRRRKTKTCKSCIGGPRELELSEFGIDRARPDDRNVRCRDCVRRISQERRAAARGEPARPVRKWTPRHQVTGTEAFVRQPGAALKVLGPLVLKAIDHAGGQASQGALVRYAAANLPGRVHAAVVQEQIGEALGELFQRRAIATRGEAEGRVYFRRDFVRRW